MTIYGRSLLNIFLQAATYSRTMPMPCVSEDKSVINGKRYSNFRVAPTKPIHKYNRKCVERYKNKSSTTNR